MSKNIRLSLGAVLLFGGGALLLVMVFGSDLVHDIALRGRPMTLASGERMLGAKCTRYNFVVSACTVGHGPREGNRDRAAVQEKRELHYLMFGSVAGERVFLLQPVGQNGAITTNVGLAHLGNRIVTLGVLAGLPLLFLIWGFVRLLGRNSSDAVAPQPIPQALASAYGGTTMPPSNAGMSARTTARAPGDGFGRRFTTR